MMSSAAHIGLNETHLGIIAPQNIFGLPFQRAVGERQAEKLLQTGTVVLFCF
jgi:enoyl-CoA hydratase/carnithine racemase